MNKLADIISPRDAGKIFETIHAMVALMEKDGALVSWNSAFEALIHSLPSADRFFDLVSTQHKDLLRRAATGGKPEIWTAAFPLGRGGAAVSCECALIPAQNERLIFVAERIDSETALRGELDKLYRQVRLFQIESDFTKKLAHNKQIELDAVVAQAQEVAQTDPLTYLYNRRAITRELQHEVLRAERYGSMLSVSIIDVDHFKLINDTYGHAIGDEVLRQVAHRLRDGIRHPDIIGRYGGEEFIILLPNSNLKGAEEQADRLCREVREMDIVVKDHNIKVTLSIGVAQLKMGMDTWDSLLNRADTAMYEAKNRGRNCWVSVD
jgi:diguanylate cyclase (GGDEF)-like protein